MKRVLIISPHFPPVNAADMHRVRQSLPFFKEFGWEAEVVAVDPAFVESYSIDPLLNKTIPEDIPVHFVKAWNVEKTRRFGLGSLSIRSFFFFRKKGNELLSKKKFDLIYFSTTAFHVMALGPYWKRKFKVPFILDIQDPWRNDFYLDKPVAQRPPKFFISYNIDKYLEARTIPFADGIISVSQGYCDDFLQRYPSLTKEQCRVITFGATANDFEVMKQYVSTVQQVELDKSKINILYVGRGGHDLRFAIEIIFKAFKKGLESHAALFSPVHFWFIGTSYAAPGTGGKTIYPFAKELGVADFVTEITDRIPYFETLYLLDKADMLLVPGSTDTAYTASKIYPYVLAKKKLLAVFHKKSSVVNILEKMNFGTLVIFDEHSDIADTYVTDCFTKLYHLLDTIKQKPELNEDLFEPFTARVKTQEQTRFFDEVVPGNIMTVSQA